jgi:hypothetical protein
VLKSNTKSTLPRVKFQNEYSEWRSETIKQQLPIQESVIYYQSILAIRFRHQESRVRILRLSVKYHPFIQQFLDHFPHLLESWWGTLARCVIARGSAQINLHPPPLPSPFQAYPKTISENPPQFRLASAYARGPEWNRVQPAYGTAPSHIVFINPFNAELNPICHLLALLAHHILRISRITVKRNQSLTRRRHKRFKSKEMLHMHSPK